MTDFKAKMHQIRFRLGFRPRPRWGSLQHSPGPLAGFGAGSRQGGLGWGRGGKGGGEEEGGEMEGREREGPKLLLNQGPSEPCYATVGKGLYCFSTYLNVLITLRAELSGAVSL